MLRVKDRINGTNINVGSVYRKWLRDSIESKKPYDQMFSKAKFVFKNGKKIIQDGKICNIIRGSTQSLKLNYDKKIRKNIKKWFDNYYSLDLETFEIDDNFFSENNFNYL